ncbi:Sporulation protein YhaL [Bacillus altitudinis]|uniref:sporulation YhaL family protein n=1 Tax=Bacillus altitudinis TaxID=293387 RepID=UPI0009110073|nr:sporulation YhaL family protein [Bacillus altitudinis]SFX97745.1 Sporulation protein YhaL [Bacillus altitudinis]SNS47965.1 Sporulation protein YhaL [Bacillus altitudinis]
MLFFPWWVYACIIGIIFCAYKLMTTAKEEQEIDQSFIEKEGEIFIERMEQERERRRQGQQMQMKRAQETAKHEDHSIA